VKSTVKKIAGILLAGLLTLTLLPHSANAKLDVLPPQDALDEASIIVAGTVTERDFTEERRSVRIDVEQVLKGDLPTAELHLEIQKSHIYGFIGFDFPPVGEQVMVLLREYSESASGYPFVSDLNSVAVVEDGHITGLWGGRNIGLNGDYYSQADYVKAYDAYYRDYLKRQPAPGTPNQPDLSAAPTPEPLGIWGRLWQTMVTFFGRIF
jgi:hypothetical protein